MKHELTLSVDETTRMVMEQINEGIGESLRDALQPAEELLRESLDNSNGIIASNKINAEAIIRLEKTVTDGLDENRTAHGEDMTLLRDIAKSLSDTLNQFETINARQNELFLQIQSLNVRLDKEIEHTAKTAEIQNSFSQQLTDISDKLDYLSLPFFKRMAGGKRTTENGTEKGAE